MVYDDLYSYMYPVTQMMGHLMAVKDKQPVADNMFEPLKETIELLKTYGQELPDEVHQQLQVHKGLHVSTHYTQHFIYGHL